jgi:hypothetical protein
MSAPLAVTGVAVLIACSDGKLRMAILEGKQPAQVKGFVTYIQGGRLKLKDEALVLIAKPAGQ